jgi:hypothetical protein
VDVFAQAGETEPIYSERAERNNDGGRCRNRSTQSDSAAVDSQQSQDAKDNRYGRGNGAKIVQDRVYGLFDYYNAGV